MLGPHARYHARVAHHWIGQNDNDFCFFNNLYNSIEYQSSINRVSIEYDMMCAEKVMVERIDFSFLFSLFSFLSTINHADSLHTRN